MLDAEKRPKIIVGLGNPGSQYIGTRHNVGFEVLDAIAARLAADRPRQKFDGKISVVNQDETKIVLVWPMTFMNRSGQCVNAVSKFYKVDAEQDLIVVCDDLSLPLGKLRIRAKGSAGGQKGLQDILRALGSQSVPRLRIGIDAAPPKWDAADYVLGRFGKHERDSIDGAIDKACEALLAWCSYDLEYCMNRFN